VMFSAMGWLFREANHERDRANAAAVRSANAEREARAAQEQAETALLAARRATDQQLWQQSIYSNALVGKKALEDEIKRAVQDRRAVYLQYADPQQRRAVEALRPHLGTAGWAASGSERVQSAPNNAQIRYFRKGDEGEARSLAALFKRWGWGVLRPELMKGEGGQWAQTSQFEVWLARPNPAELTRLLGAIDGPVKEDRLRALQALLDAHSASPAAIGAALDMASVGRIDTLTPAGRFNLLYFLSHTAPLAWDADQIRSARATLARVGNRAEVGKDTLEELSRLERLLAAAAGGEAIGPAS
jgi:hypothetical protein